MPKITVSPLLCAAFMMVVITSALAQSPLGIGVSEPVGAPSGPFAHVLIWIQSWQQEFEKSLSQWLVGVRHNPQNAYWLVLVSLVYGVLHAAGPGHGKAVISSYLIASHETLKRGIMLSLISSLLQAASAISLVLIAFYLLPARLTQTTSWVTNASYGLVMCLGLWLLLRKTPALFCRRTKAADALFVCDQPGSTQQPSKIFSRYMTMKYKPKLNWKKSDLAHEFSTQGQFCAACGDTHIMSPALLAEKTSWRSVLPVILSVGVRPCTGAIFVMSFAVLNGLFVIGSLSVLAMSVGTFVTVSVLAMLAVKAKQLVLRLSSNANTTSRLQALLEWCAALFIFVTGFLLFASLPHCLSCKKNHLIKPLCLLRYKFVTNVF